MEKERGKKRSSTPNKAAAPVVEANTEKKAKEVALNAGVDKRARSDMRVVSEKRIGTTTDRHTYQAKDLITNFIVLGFAIVLVQLAPTPPKDVIKPESSSFLGLYLTGKLNEVPFISQMFVAAVCSLFFDIGVVSYHLSNPPHPKYVMILSRKISIYTHLTSGIIEIVCGVIAFTVPDHDIQRLAGTVTSLASITHALTAYYQTAVVFGAKGVMVPGYLYAITIHITNAFRLYQQPSSLLNLMITFLALHIYVWCRFFIYFFRVLKAFTGFHYTIAITLSGALLFPYAMGPVGNFNFLFVCALYVMLQAFFVGVNVRGLFVEHERYALVTADSVAKWKEAVAVAGGAEDGDKMRAKDVFDRYDASKNGTLEREEVDYMFRMLNIPKDNIKRLMGSANFARDGSITFDDFYRYVWNFGTVQDRLKGKHVSKDSVDTKSDKEKARLIFDMLDLDGGGTIGLSEIEVLLTQWGMPDGEAERYLSKYGANKTISFDVFFKQMRPIWEFGVTEVVKDPAKEGGD